MADIPPLHPICELASRSTGGIEVTLVWDRRSDELRVCVTDSHTDFSFELETAHADALDVFHHPYAYAAARGIAYDPARETATGEEQPLPLAA